MRVMCLMAVLMATSAVAAAAQDGADRGRKLYASEKCGVCHSVGDQGNKRGPLDAVGARLSADDIRSWLVNPAEMTAKTKATRKPLMKSYAHLAKDDVDALVAYMQSLEK